MISLRVWVQRPELVLFSPIRTDIGVGEFVRIRNGNGPNSMGYTLNLWAMLILDKQTEIIPSVSTKETEVHACQLDQ